MRKSYSKYLSFLFLLFSIAAFSFSTHTFTQTDVETVKQDKKQFENNCFYSSSSMASKAVLQRDNLTVIYSFDKGRDLPVADLNNQFSAIYSVRTNSSFTGKIVESTGNHLSFIYPSHNFW